MMKRTKKLLALLLSGALAVSALSGCSSNDSGDGQEVLNIFTWADYFPQSILDEFTAETGIKVNYNTFESNEEMLMKLQTAEGGDYDIILASDYIIDIAVNEGLVAKLDKEQIPNFGNINPEFQGKFYDETNEYTVPYAAGIPLIIYNPSMIDFEVTGYEDLWRDELADSVVVVDDARNIIGITLKTMGKSFNETDPAVLEQAKEKLMGLKKNIRAFDYSTPYNLMISGETSIGYMFTSQVVLATKENPDLKVCFPKEGMGFGIDSVFVPSAAPNSENAYKFINFILDGERSARISEETMYIYCNSAATPYITEEALILPEGALDEAEFIQDVGDATSIYNDIWTEFKMS